ncbi:bifunctional metallophosphatase/5'-nucleotidase [Fructilactobacillus cliffordii]|uniref:bifunctional metallophosphatase/5'-nucleotidase n=1 Tax=Fructilactobacillus cliffordii TaxID=2940299 RepID=UPI002091EA24|nr:bifunctional metallophosphatase/5'-nucleotidase [Fructilactobacillus cliffordii]USS85921.1 bifunctional metallophosphatase/5'-nucleotidase [Fructilactobacillus cliffordii]
MPKTIKLLSTSDVHGYVYPTNYSTKDNYTGIGLLKAGTIIKQAREQATADEIILAVENGDLIQGSPLTSYLAEQPDTLKDYLTGITSQIGYDAGVLGNHEFNYGIDYIRAAEAKRNYPILSANIMGAENEQIADAPYQIIEKQGIKIAILGLTTAFVPNWEMAENIQGLTFNSILETAQALVPQLRQQADVVIVAYHGGLEADPETGEPTEKETVENEGYRLLTTVPGIDALITGHQHRELAGTINHVPFTQPGVRGSNVGQITLTLDDDYHVINGTSQLLKTADVAIDESLLPDPQVENQVQAWLEESVGTVTGADLRIHDHLQARLHGHPYLDLINQVQMEALGTDISGTALFNNEITGLSPRVSMREIISNYSYPNTAFSERITGKEMRDALEQNAKFFTVRDGQIVINDEFVKPKLQLYNYDVYSGIDYEFDISQPVGHRVTKLNYHGQPVTDDQELVVAMNNYRAIGGGDYQMFSIDKVVQQTSETIPNLMIKYLQEHDPYHATEPNNFRVRASELEKN